MKQYKETLLYLDLLQKYNKLAKKADRRMRNLEKLSQEPGFQNVLKYAYARAKYDIEAWTPPGKDKMPRWQRNTPMDTSNLKAKIKDIETFLNAPTSTKRGIINVYDKRVKTINKRYGTSFTWQDLAEYFDTGLKDKTDKYGSKTILQAIGRIQKSKEQVIKNFMEHKPTSLKIADETYIDESGKEVKYGTAVEQRVNTLLRYYKKDLSKILN